MIQTRNTTPAEIRQKRPRIKTPVKIPHYVIEAVNPIGTSPEITEFLKEREIYQAAIPHFKELSYYVLDCKGIKKSFKAAAMQNQKFGWQVLSRHYNGCIGKEALTLIRGDTKQAVVFENQYSYIVWKAVKPAEAPSVIILNSWLLLADAIQAAKCYPDVTLFLQRNPAGLAAADTFIRTIPYVRDHSIDLYR